MKDDTIKVIIGILRFLTIAIGMVGVCMASGETTDLTFKQDILLRLIILSVTIIGVYTTNKIAGKLERKIQWQLWE